MIDIGRLGTFGLAGLAALTLSVEAFVQEFNSARVGAVLLVIVLLHLVRFGRVVVTREAIIYACFLGYMLLQLLWTGDLILAMNTLVPAANFLIVMVLFGSLAALHELKFVIAGALAGFLLAAVAYSRLSGFPLQYPAEFSYNSIAGMYLFGLILTLLLATFDRWKAPLLLLAVVIAIHIVATTSIKTNLGILLGTLVVVAVHFRFVRRQLWRHLVAIIVIGAIVAFSVATNEAAVERIQRGASRVALGIEILQAREDLPGYSAFERRAFWQREGFEGWAQNPVFGHGVEAFRSRFGLTSHASHVDILYNSGLIGTVLFYGIFVSMLYRLYRSRHGDQRNASMVILGGLICYLFISFAGTIHYIATLAAFLALGIGILKRA